MKSRETNLIGLQLYQRDAMRKGGETPMREVQRFVADNIILGW